MTDAARPIDSELEAERRPLEAAVAKARADRRPPASHDLVRADMLREIERLNSKIATR